MTIWFEYHCYEGEDSCDAELWHHTHQQVIILHLLAQSKGDIVNHGKMYSVRFDDGFEYDVFEEELVASPKDFYRPDYRKVKYGISS